MQTMTAAWTDPDGQTEVKMILGILARSSQYPALNGIDADGDGTVSDADHAAQRAAFPVVPVAAAGLTATAGDESDDVAQDGG